LREQKLLDRLRATTQILLDSLIHVRQNGATGFWPRDCA